MKKISLVLMMCCIYIAGISAQVSQERSVGTFNGISVCCGIEVLLSEGQSSKIIVKANQNTLSKVKTEVKGNTLHIGFDRSANNRNDKVSVYVTAKNLVLLEANASGQIKGMSDINAKDIRMHTNSAGGITLNLKADNVICESNSAGTINLTGTAAYAKVSNNSASSINMRHFTANRADVSSNSGASISIGVKDQIKAHANSGGSVKYYGNPSKSDISSNSGGSVKKK